MNKKVMLSSVNMNMRTPMSLVRSIEKLAGRRFAVDAAAMKGHEVARRGIGPRQKRTDCLTDEPWAKPGSVVFMNPPYGRKLGKFIERACREAGRGVDVWILVPARTDTQWFNLAARWASDVYFIEGRVIFLGEDGKPLRDEKGRIMPAPFPSAVMRLSRRSVNVARGCKVRFGWKPRG